MATAIGAAPTVPAVGVAAAEAAAGAAAEAAVLRGRAAAEAGVDLDESWIGTRPFANRGRAVG